MKNTKNSSGPNPAISLHVTDYPFYYMWHIASESQRCIREAILAYELSWQDWRIIFLLHDYDGITINELADQVLIDATTLTRILKSMENRNLLSRTKSKGDQRYTQIKLSKGGLSLYEKVIPIVMRQLDSAYQGLDKGELILLDKILRKMKNNVYRSPFSNPE
jgi:DNA-binding MarR family transcriptional regulator